MILPDLILLSDYDAANYIDVIYRIFKSNVVDGKLAFLGLPITYPWHPSYDNKHFCFWHLITNKFESEYEADRLPDMRRCERIRWVDYVIYNANDREKIWCWEKNIKTKRGCNKHIALYLHEEHYLVVLRRKQNRLELVTAYVKKSHGSMVNERAKNKDPRENN